jgi:hypothetical protein
VWKEPRQNVSREKNFARAPADRSVPGRAKEIDVTVLVVYANAVFQVCTSASRMVDRWQLYVNKISYVGPPWAEWSAADQ